MVESRCGILCSECEEGKKVGCKGCVNIANPFWGACALKKSCEDKKLTHCGKCETFPCEMLSAFSFDQEHGDGGKRIEQCKIWKKED